MLKTIWKLVRSRKPKHKDAMFIRDSETGEWIGKAYGHEGQNVLLHANLMAAAPQLLETVATLVDDIERCCSVIGNREPHGANYVVAKHIVKLYGAYKGKL